MYRSGRLAALLAGAAIAAAANAQAPAGQASAAQASPQAAEQVASTPLYHVEIIVFAYNDADPTEEIFSNASPPNPNPAFEDGLLPLQTLDFDAAARALSSVSDEAQAGTAGASAGTPPASELSPAPPQSPDGEAASQPPTIGPQGFQVLGADALTLDDAYAKLGRIDAYTPLLHAAWIQPALPEDQAPAVSMSALGALNPMGTIHFYESRYLHVTIDLSYRPTSAQLAALEQASLARSHSAGGPEQAGTAASATDGGVPSSGFGAAGDAGIAAADGTADVNALPSNAEDADEALNEISLGPELTMKTSRRVDAGKLEYFDHPYFGLLVLITPYEPKNETPTKGGVKPAA
ncbi:MAG TPA: CsiV family protein [Gammaproteobacteria bacterium]|nr:CsiV family protein [Gammaproteobacteria bacterium]